MSEDPQKLQLYSVLNRQWKSLSKSLLGDEMGELDDYKEWLYGRNGPRLVKSSVSGKDVVLAYSPFGGNSEFISLEEVDWNKSYIPLSINDIKDIDSIVEAIRNRAVYCGNIIFGNSGFVEESTNITDSQYVLHSERVAYSKYVAYSSRGGYSEVVFGCYGFGPARFCIKANSWEVSRVFCSSKIEFSSDIYLSHGLSGCHDCMFCFNLKSKRLAIGNLVLPKDKYLQIKKKLMEEIRQELIRNKYLSPIDEMVCAEKPDYSFLKKSISGRNWEDEKKDMGPIEKAFSETALVILGKPLRQIDSYSDWLEKNSAVKLEQCFSCASGKQIPLLPDYVPFISFPRDRLITQDEADFLGERMTLSEGEVESLSFKNIPKKLSKIAYFCPFWLSGKLKNNIDSPMCIDSVDCYRGLIFMRSKKCAFCFSPTSCENSFGCREPRDSSFCINCHFSTKISRCLEVDNSTNCSGCYFCHNCDNVHDSMFCFNTKNKRYAIGNVEVGREKFMQAKEILLDWGLKRLEKNCDLGVDVFTIADWKEENR